MMTCRFCGEALSKSDSVKKCKVCGEPQGWRVYFWGMVLKYIPLGSALSVVVALASLYIAYLQHQETRRAEAREEAAQRQVQETTSQLHTIERAADRAIGRLTQKLPEPARENILGSLDLWPGANLYELEDQVQKTPSDVQKREKLFLYRALKQRKDP